MKIIFLDIDGVLATNRSYRVSRLVRWGPFDRVAVENLNVLIHLSGAKVVISSLWRTDLSLDMKLVLKRAGVQCDIVGETPALGGRGFEIAAWRATPKVLTALPSWMTPAMRFCAAGLQQTSCQRPWNQGSTGRRSAGR